MSGQGLIIIRLVNDLAAYADAHRREYGSDIGADSSLGRRLA